MCIRDRGKTLANIKSAKKRNRQNETRRLKNSSVKSSIRTENKKVLNALTGKEAAGPEEIKALFNGFVSKIDNAAAKNIYHWKTAARKKSRLAKKVNAVKGS